ncbi:FG-GAP-like repeat-containing protein, partial [Streptomyces sp. NPDC051940]|uniref:FG-GAP-like repeat-containing protein n=1 Tax=Streptomyces sp. NPDC051940 TaxID=3155675 RepID=UPI00342525C1
MGYQRTNQGRRLSALLGAALTLAAVSAVLPAVPAAADTAAGTVVLPQEDRRVPRSVRVLNAGATGFLYAQEGDDRLHWVDYATGAETILAQRLPEKITYNPFDGFRGSANGQAYYGAGSDTVALYSDTPAPHVTLQQGAGGGATTEIAIPEGQTYYGTFGTTVVTKTGPALEPTSYHLLRSESGTVTDTPVTGVPEGAKLDQSLEDGDSRSVVLRYSTAVPDGTVLGFGIVDLADGVMRALPYPGSAWSVNGWRLGRDSLLRLMDSSAAVVDRADPTTVIVPRVESGSVTYDSAFALLGDSVLAADVMQDGNSDYIGQPLVELGVEGQPMTRLLDGAQSSFVVAPDGSVLVAGTEAVPDQGTPDWAVYRFSRAADGSLVRKRLATIAPMPAWIYGLSLGSGILTTADEGTAYSPGGIMGGYHSTWLATKGTPSAVRHTADGVVSGREGDCHAFDLPRSGCVTMWAGGDGFHGREEGTEQGATMLLRNGTATWGPQIDTGEDSPRLADLSGRFGVVNGASSDNQYVVGFQQGTPGTVVQKRDRVGAAVWGSTLWSGGTSGSTVTATRLPSGGQITSFTTRNGCLPSELQAVGRWVYWSCIDHWGSVQGAGVFDSLTRQTMTAPAKDVLLGDGYFVQYLSGQGLKLIDLHSGLPASGAYTDLPAKVLATETDIGPRHERRSDWTVDRFGGHVAYVDPDRHVHVVPTGIAAPAMNVIDSVEPGTSLDLRTAAATWSGKWWLSKPAATWTLAIRDKVSGAVVRTLGGGEARGALATSWDGRTSTGAYVPNGAYTWSLTVQPADGAGAALVRTGAVKLTGGAPVRRDQVGADALGDLLSLSSTGAFSFHKGGGFTTKVSGAAWSTSLVAVPFGDVNGDRCNDVLVRFSSGTLRAFKPGCGAALSSTTPYTSLGTGWELYNAFTSPGDMTGDGRADLLARGAKTGTLYLFPGTADGKLGARKVVRTSWSGFSHIVGAGDLNGDGIGDVLARSTSGKLYRCYGRADGTLGSGVVLWSDWGASYKEVVGVGDITGDGKADLVVRDKYGNLYRNAGNGNGTFGGRVKV